MHVGMRMSRAFYKSLAHFRPGRNLLMNMKKVSNSILWILVALYAIVSLVGPLHALLIFLVIAFGLLHGARRYRWRGILAFLIICLVVSNLLELTSITTGFPFGHYHYTDLVGPM